MNIIITSICAECAVCAVLSICIYIFVDDMDISIKISFLISISLLHLLCHRYGRSVFIFIFGIIAGESNESALMTFKWVWLYATEIW